MARHPPKVKNLNNYPTIYKRSINMDIPNLTIVIPSYNHSSYILECLAPALTIDPEHTKILIIDDGSTDNTIEKLNSFLKNYECAKRVEIISKKNSGLVDSLNLALSMIDTEFTYLIASDDIPSSEGITSLISKMKENPSIGFVIGGGSYFSGNGTIGDIYKKQHSVFFALAPENREQSIFTDYPSPLLLQSTVFRTQSLRAIGGWDKDLKWDDYPIFVKLLSGNKIIGHDFDFSPTIKTVLYRQHDNNAYKNIIKQYGMTEQTLKKIAPEKIKRKAVSRAFAFYTLMAIKDGDIRSVISLFKHASLFELTSGLLNIPFVAYANLIRNKL